MRAHGTGERLLLFEAGLHAPSAPARCLARCRAGVHTGPEDLETTAPNSSEPSAIVSAMRVEWVADATRFAALEPRWDELAERQRSPFVRHAWFAAWWAAFGRSLRLRVCTLWDGEELAAALPLYERRGHLAPLVNAHSNEFPPLARDEQALSELILTVLATSSELRLDLVPGETGFFDTLVRTCASDRRMLLVLPGPASPVIDTTGDLEAWWSGLSGNTRGDVRRRRRRLDALPAVEQRILAEPEDIEVELRRGLAVEGSGWKSRRGTAILSSQETTEFYREVAARFTRLNKLRLSTISIGGEVAAFAFNLVDHDRVWLLKTGYDPAYAEYSPGKLLMLAQVERCFELGISSFELLGDADQWKLRLTPDVRPHWTVATYAMRPLPLASYGVQRFVKPAARRGYRWLRRQRGLR